VEKQYTLQVASLVREQNALALKNRLEKLGYTPVIRKLTAPITHHRVFAGEFSTREEAERAARKLNVDGFPSRVVPITGGKFAPEAGSFLRLNQAIDLAHQLQQKTFTAKIVSEPTPTPVHQVRVGEYENRAEALEALDSLKRKGLKPLIVKR
jgi:cell division septation protein DedD